MHRKKVSLIKEILIEYLPWATSFPRSGGNYCAIKKNNVILRD